MQTTISFKSAKLSAFGSRSFRSLPDLSVVPTVLRISESIKNKTTESTKSSVYRVGNGCLRPFLHADDGPWNRSEAFVIKLWHSHL